MKYSFRQIWAMRRAERLLRRVSFFVLDGSDRMRLRLVERVPDDSRRYPTSLREVHGGCITGRRQVYGLAVPVGSLSMPGMRGSPARWWSRGRFRRGGPGGR